MRILLSGSTGFIGSALFPFLTEKGHKVFRLMRSSPAAGEFQGDKITWDPAAGTIDAAQLEGFDAVIHLAGESIASGRWTEAKKQRIRDSRVRGTQLLAEALSRLNQPPKVFISASAIGFYGDRQGETLHEESTSGKDFLAEVCRAWEAAAKPAETKGIRVVHPRLGVVLSPKGGALAKMLPPFKMGVGGKIGPGTQYMSWVALDDVLGAFHHVLTSPLRGPVNVVAPDPVTNLDFTKALGRALSRPTIFPMPALAARLAFGEMADALLLASQRVEPRALHKSSYAFRYPALESALKHLLNR